MGGLQSPNRQLQMVAMISSIGCALVIVTSIFPSMRSKLFMRIIACISFSTMCGNLPYLTVIRTANGSIWCTVQGFLNLLFYPASWVWTTILMGFLYKVATEGHCPFSQLLIHSVGWGLPFVTTMLILTTNSFERFSDNDDTDVCTIGGPFETAFLWHIFSYYGIFLACLIVMLTLYIRVQQKRCNASIAVSPQMAKLVVDSLQLYPFFIVVCWTPEMVAFIIQYVADNDNLYHSALLIKLAYGFVTTCIFFGKSQHARKLWIRCLLGRKLQSSRPMYSVDTVLSENSDIFGGDFIETGQDPFVRTIWPNPLLDESYCNRSLSEVGSVAIG